MSQIQQFYVGQNIFITGQTGFMGKILTEKLIRSCREIGTIYLLIRAKKGKSVEERRDALLAEPVIFAMENFGYFSKIFAVLRNDYPNFSEKIVCIVGDIAEERLGLTVTDFARLVDEVSQVPIRQRVVYSTTAQSKVKLFQVSVIFHLAVTVRFNEKLEVALAINVNSVKSVIDVARECKNLKVGVYVSTAYSHCVRKSIDEKLYPSPCASYEEVKGIISKAKANELSEDVTEAILGEWPNTYTFSKAVAEGVVTELAKDLPFAIFRPSIVASSYKEPIPGWLPSPFGIFGVSHFKDDSVYNYVSGSETPITWRQCDSKGSVALRSYPTEKAIYYPFYIDTKSRLLFYILEICFHFFPALIIDNVARLMGKEPQ
ncbi:fatty acyl-CoA reductase 1-like [Neodiprion lecontei]|uniref:Fatty acyl-CoA reductase n=1 Tax=Neodiprion lecontei TaxID=441921 RepID=A0ABM3FQK8_NEOLC|nr:fatty acyl-CoA reductase 1-like [Neodiprion lecontei]